jgi:hypothetical protein
VPRRVVTLPDRGRLVVATDFQGNVRDFCAVEELFEREARAPGGAFLVVTGDLVHGPELEPDEWPEYLGTYYRGDSPSVLRRARALQRRHPGRVFYLMGNHEHAHVGGPIVAKFFADEAERLEYLLGPDGTADMHEWLEDWPFVAIAPHSGLAMMHAAPHAAIASQQDLERLPLDVMSEGTIDPEARTTLLSLLWARTTTTERAQAFLHALDEELAVVVYGHDVAPAGYAIDREPMLCVSTSFGCFDGDKSVLVWDLAERATTAHEVARRGLRPLYPDAPPVHRLERRGS